MPEEAAPLRRPVRRRRRALLPTLIALGVLLVLFSIFTSIYTDLLWYRSVGFSSVFSHVLRTRLILFVLFGALMAGAVAVNFVLAFRARPAYQALVPGQAELDRYRMAIDPYRRWIVIGLVALIGLLGGSSAAGQWRTYMQWRNGVSFGVKDPQFHKDISFFVFTLPMWRWVLGFAFTVVVLSIIAAVATHYLYGGLRLTPVMGERATPAARVHLSVLLGLFVLLKAIGYWLDRYSLAVKGGQVGRASFTGLTYTDVNAVLPGRTILAAAALICAVLFFANVAFKNWLLPGIAVGLLLISAILIGGIYPAVVHRFQVKPAEPDKEAPYLARNIAATRAAYGVDNAKVSEYSAKTDATQNQLRGDAETTTSIRLLDPNVLSPTYQNLQQIKGYYDFPDTLSVDRYTIDKKKRDVVLAVREMDLAGLPAEQRGWVNDHTVYTHGFGIVAALGNTAEKDGKPSFISSDIPPIGSLGTYEPRVYFGQRSPSYSIVGGTGAIELDYPADTASGTGQQNTSYKGKGGVKVDSLFRKILYASKYQDTNILISSRVSKGARILYVRDPKARVEKVAPWLTLDGQPYPAIVDNKILWVVDGYTTANGYPYSTRTDLDAATEDSQTTAGTAVLTPTNNINYIRNSVKATVDAYDGTVTLYQWDEKDPVLKTWMKAFPGTVKPKAGIDAALLAHLRYPEDMFKVQRDILARYHVTDSQAFYNGGDYWRIPDDPTSGATSKLQPPYYLTLEMPGQSSPSFSLTSSFVPSGRRENLAGFIAVNSDPGPDYGTIRVLQIPRSVQISGPQQAQNAFSQPAITTQLNVLKIANLVKYGNLLTLPVGGGLLYVEPVYVQASTGTGSFPQLSKVLVGFGEKVAIGSTLQEALDTIFGGRSGVNTGEQPPGTTTPPPGGTTTNADLQRALADAQKALADSAAALKAQDFTAYGEAQKRLQDAISRAVAAEQKASTTTPGTPSPSPSPTGSTTGS